MSGGGDCPGPGAGVPFTETHLSSVSPGLLAESVSVVGRHSNSDPTTSGEKQVAVPVGGVGLSASAAAAGQPDAERSSATPVHGKGRCICWW